MALISYPEGYVLFSQMQHVLEDPESIKRWNINKNPMHLFELNKIIEKLADGSLLSAGVEEETGLLFEISPSAWRIIQTSGAYFDNHYIYDDAVLGKRIVLLGPKEGFIICRPVVAMRDLAITLGAQSPPPAPALQPRSWISASALSIDDGQPHAIGTLALARTAAKSAQVWMRGYGLAMNEVGIKPKRELTLRLCQSETGCTYRQAKAAWNALPASWKNHPRTLEA